MTGSVPHKMAYWKQKVSAPFRNPTHIACLPASCLNH